MTKTLIAIAVVLLAVSFYALAPILAGVTPPALSNVALGLALIARDGVLALIVLVGLIGTAALSAWAVLQPTVRSCGRLTEAPRKGDDLDVRPMRRCDL